MFMIIIIFSLDSVLDHGFKNNTNLMSLDLESFLATMTIPPPPQTNGRLEEKRASVLTSEEISSFIIPPPPPKALATKATTAITANATTDSKATTSSAATFSDNQPKPENEVKRIPTSVSVATTPADGPSATNEKTLPGFSCCSRPRPRSPDNQPPCLPTRAQNMTLPRVKPKVPPRIDSTLSTKPPLPPMPSQVRRVTNLCVI